MHLNVRSSFFIDLYSTRLDSIRINIRVIKAEASDYTIKSIITEKFVNIIVFAKKVTPRMQPMIVPT